MVIYDEQLFLCSALRLEGKFFVVFFDDQKMVCSQFFLNVNVWILDLKRVGGLKGADFFLGWLS
jgi:hypothetical protein